MSVSDGLLLVAAGFGAGILSTVASIASVLSYPVLLALGLPPLTANVTNTMSLVLTGAGSVLGSRLELAGQRARVLRLGLFTALGGAAGAAALLLAPASAFAAVVPVLVGGSAVILLIQPWIKSLNAQPGAERSPVRRAGLFCVAGYVGYFGAAGGILLLATLGSMIDDTLVRLNALKNVLSGFANAVAAIAFAIWAPVHWAYVPPLAAGFLIGGFIGPRIIRRVPTDAFRVVIALCGLALAAKLGLSAYR
ncbi:MAG: sulfite exporter TauE/SafE family protein [Streptosporangiaceae bacterium]|jgi:uncharacterized membrane protein YfcA